MKIITVEHFYELPHIRVLKHINVSTKYFAAKLLAWSIKVDKL
jgi:hypothetical protein